MRLGPLLSALLVLAVLMASSALASAQEPGPAAEESETATEQTGPATERAGPASERSEYDRLVDEALAEFDAGHFEEALSAFEQSYKVRPSARALRGVAKALFELRSYVRCVEAIDRAFASEVDPLTPSLHADLDSLKTRALRFVGAVVIEVTPGGATVAIDGEPIDARAATKRVIDVGTHTLDVSLPDHLPLRRTFVVHGGEVTRVPVRLDPVRAAVSAAAPSSSVEGRTGRLALTIAAVAASTGALVGSSIWFVDRGEAVARCDDAAAAGARCGNADSIAFQRNAATWTLGLSGVALVVSAAALVFALRGEPKPPPRTAALWTW